MVTAHIGVREVLAKKEAQFLELLNRVLPNPVSRFKFVCAPDGRRDEFDPPGLEPFAVEMGPLLIGCQRRHGDAVNMHLLKQVQYQRRRLVGVRRVVPTSVKMGIDVLFQLHWWLHSANADFTALKNAVKERGWVPMGRSADHAGTYLVYIL